MKIRELKDLLETMNDSDEVAIRVTPLSVGMGGSPYVTPYTVSKGFDWNSGKIFLEMKEELALMTKEEYLNVIKFLQSSGTMSTHEVNKRYLERRDSKLKKDIEDAIRRSCDGEIPTSSEDIYQCDWFQIGSAEFMDYVCNKFKIYNNGENE